MDRKLICQMYLRGWFVLDVLSSVPWDLVFKGVKFGNIWQLPKVLKILRVSKLLRLLRFARIIRYVGRFRVM